MEGASLLTKQINIHKSLRWKLDNFLYIFLRCLETQLLYVDFDFVTKLNNKNLGKRAEYYLYYFQHLKLPF